VTIRLTRDEILNGLNRLLELCTAHDLAVRVQVVGGGAIALRYNMNRQPTVDVDCIVLGETSHRERFAQLILDVASEFGWPNDWMNHKVGIFWPETNDNLGWITILVDGASQVEIAGPRMLLAMKLRAGRPLRDVPDIDVLLDHADVHSLVQAEEVFDEYFPYDAMPARTMVWLKARFAS